MAPPKGQDKKISLNFLENTMKSQVSVEMLLIIAIFLGVITPIFYFSFTQSTDEIKISKTKYYLTKKST